MQLRHWLASSVLLVGLAGGIALWRVPLEFRSNATLHAGPDLSFHDFYVSGPAGVPVVGLALITSTLLLAFGPRDNRD